MKKIAIILFAALTGILFPSDLFSCTSVIISGKATKDGRPLMWKNTDTQNLNHRLIYSDFRGYPLIGIVRSDAVDEARASIWIGTNSQGFSIMNTMSYNLTDESIGTNNGVLMRRALEVCKNVNEFKYYLDTLDRPMKVSANYGVIDAEGNAAYFETYSDGYHMVDVNEAIELFKNGIFPDSDFIPRRITANACVIHGVKKGENPELTTFWAVLGYPPCSVAIPAWVKAANDNSDLLEKSPDSYNSPMCDMALAIKSNVFPISRGNGEAPVLLCLI